MVSCENCRKREASVGCLLCRRNLCNDCYEEHMKRLTASMDEGFAGMAQDEVVGDEPVMCEICGQRVESQEKDEHLFEVHGISI